MKVFAFAIVLAIVAAVHAQGVNFNEEQEKAIAAVRNECLKKTGAELSAVIAIGSGDFSSPTESAKCFAKCYEEGFGFLTNGKLNKEVIVKTLSNVVGPNNAKIIADLCAKVQGPDNCDTALEIFRCNYYARIALLTKNGVN